nr:1-acyl-sn-glycerol-3-phosphate acyltransferase [bacterium]
MRKRADPRERRPRRPEPPTSPAWEIAAKLFAGLVPQELKQAAAGVLASLIRGRKGGPGVDEFGMDPSFMEWLRPFFEFLYYAYFRVEAQGVENVPPKGPAILVANHSGALPYDGVMINLAVFNEHARRRNVRFLVEDFVFATPLLRDFISRAGGVRACHENATKLIERGELIVV